MSAPILPSSGAGTVSTAPAARPGAASHGIVQTGGGPHNHLHATAAQSQGTVLAGQGQDGAPVRRGRLTTASLVCLIVAASAPLTVLAGGIPTAYAVSGLLGVPLGFLVLGAVFALFSVGYGRMSAAVRNPGALYAFVCQGLGVRAGIGAAILALVTYNLMQVGLYGMLGFSAANLWASLTGMSVPWWVAGFLGWLVVAAAGVRSIDFSAKVVAVVVVAGIAVCVGVCVLSLATAPEGVTVDGLRPSQMFTPGVGVLVAFSLAAFMGFESGAIYAEEAREPERTVPRATYIAVGLISVFYAVCAWALTVGIGRSRILEESAQSGPDLVFVFLARYSPAASMIASALFVFSLLAAPLAFHNAVARYFYALGRSGVLPGVLARTGAGGAPVGGSLAQSAIAAVVVVGFVLAGFGSQLGELYPVLTLFTWLTNAAGFGVVVLLTVTGVAIIRWSVGRSGSVLVRLGAPVLSVLGMVALALTVLVNFDLMIAGAGPGWLRWVMPGVVLASGVAGTVWGEVLRRRRPAVFASVASSFETIKV